MQPPPNQSSWLGDCQPSQLLITGDTPFKWLATETWKSKILMVLLILALP